MHKRFFGLALAALLLVSLMAGCTVSGVVVSTGDPCAFIGNREAAIAIGTAKRIRIDHTIGSLIVTGQAGAAELKATGTACATRQDLLDGIKLTALVQGDEVRLTAELPRVYNGSSPKIDLNVELPDNLPLVVERETGTNEFRHVASLDLHKGVGTSVVDGVTGDVTLESGTGTTAIRNIQGSVRVRTGVGELTVENVDGDLTVPSKGTGTFTIREIGRNLSLPDLGVGTLSVRQVKGDLTIGDKGTGSVSIAGVGRNVLIQSLGVGSCDVRDVKGNLTVRQKGTGSLTYSNITGTVDVPRGK
jgi:hypothetical protein